MAQGKYCNETSRYHVVINLWLPAMLSGDEVPLQLMTAEYQNHTSTLNKVALLLIIILYGSIEE